ncbi:head-tail connector protein [Mycobacterium phage Sparky]|uniref:Head-to-tail connector n=1 Tax=Mycobacterium phage Sparky TaxID=1527493 RepID=A0A076G766_9CAUD|nr:head-tail connector protein [Mycobacterium phage Sparky]AII28157.1 head-to-tail connector [Mycobacterium phage Sparky]
MQCEIPSNPNPFLTHYMLSPENVSVMRQAGTLVRDVYRAIVAKDEGDLAESAEVQLALGGTKFDRICADVIVGSGTPRGGYGASHEFGIGIHPDSRVPPTSWMPQAPVDDFVKVLAIVDSLA